MPLEPYLRQVFAGPMGNCLYVLGDPQSKQAYVVDPAWDPLGLVGLAEEAGFSVTGVLATHLHQDHVGGEFYGQRIPGIRELVAERELPVFIHELEAEAVVRQTGVDEGAIRSFPSEATLELGELAISCLHTPGHSPGCTSFLIGSQLISGDTLFVQGCGRVDLPGSDIDDMFRSLRRLAELPPETAIYPGHNYGPAPTSTIGDELQRNAYLRVEKLEQWQVMMGGG